MTATTTANCNALTATTTKDEALTLLMAGTISVEDYKRWDASKSMGTLRCKVSEKGAISVYGLSAKWPVTLYVGQWERLVEFMPQLVAFARANNEKLSRK
jgi:hypothetical protein